MRSDIGMSCSVSAGSDSDAQALSDGHANLEVHDTFVQLGCEETQYVVLCGRRVTQDKSRYKHYTERDAERCRELWPEVTY